MEFALIMLGLLLMAGGFVVGVYREDDKEVAGPILKVAIILSFVLVLGVGWLLLLVPMMFFMGWLLSLGLDMGTTTSGPKDDAINDPFSSTGVRGDSQGYSIDDN